MREMTRSTSEGVPSAYLTRRERYRGRGRGRGPVERTLTLDHSSISCRTRAAKLSAHNRHESAFSKGENSASIALEEISAETRPSSTGRRCRCNDGAYLDWPPRRDAPRLLSTHD